MEMQLFDNETNHHSIFSVILFVYTVKFFDEEKHFLFIIREDMLPLQIASSNHPEYR